MVETPRHSVEEVYERIGLSDEELGAVLDASIGPRGPDMLFDPVEELGIGPGQGGAGRRVTRRAGPSSGSTRFEASGESTRRRTARDTRRGN